MTTPAITQSENFHLASPAATVPIPRDRAQKLRWDGHQLAREWHRHWSIWEGGGEHLQKEADILLMEGRRIAASMHALLNAIEAEAKRRAAA